MTSREGRRLTEAYRQTQIRAQADMVGRSRLLGSLLNPSDLDASGQILVPTMVDVVRGGVEDNAKVTATYLREQSRVETGRTIMVAEVPFDAEAVALDMEIRGPITAKHFIGKGLDEDLATAKAMNLVAAGAARQVVEYGRQIVISTAAQLESELGRGRGGRWRRVTDGKPCAFCAMLAGRGPVYTSQTVDFHTHDSCGCVGEIVYGDWEPTDLERQWREAYVDAGNEASTVDGRRVAPKDGNGQDTILWRMRRDHPELFHDGWKPLGSVPTSPAKAVVPLPNVAVRDAKVLLVQATANEPAITKHIVGLADEVGGKMVGLEYKFKTETRLAEKIVKDAISDAITTEAASEHIFDALRYTMEFSESEYAVKSARVIAELRAAGWQTNVKNFWANDANPYQGVNVQLVSPTGQRTELQFHTAKSFEVKVGPLHRLYERQRVLPKGPEVDRLNEEMGAWSRTVPVPEGAKLVD